MFSFSQKILISYILAFILFFLILLPFSNSIIHYILSARHSDEAMITELARDLRFGFIAGATVVLLLFSLLSWVLVHYLTKPVREIIQVIKPYQDGIEKTIPEIKISGCHEFEQLGSTLNSLSKKLQTHIDSVSRLLEMRKDFIANASHELKTPLTIVKGFAETLHDNPELPRQMQEEITTKIVNNCERMNNIVLDLLILSDIEKNIDRPMEQVDLFEIALKCAGTVKEVYPLAKIEVNKSGAESMGLIGDSYLLELALNNLMENAAKYSEDDPEITVNMKRMGEVVQVEVADKGIGVPKEDLEHLFERFYTVDKARSRKLGGSGLGLSIVETIVHKHFGKIAVTSELGKGTTFTITLPY